MIVTGFLTEMSGCLNEPNIVYGCIFIIIIYLLLFILFYSGNQVYVLNLNNIIYRQITITQLLPTPGQICYLGEKHSTLHTLFGWATLINTGAYYTVFYLVILYAINELAE